MAIRSERRLFRHALATSLSDEAEITVVGHVSGAADLVTLHDLCRPHVVLFDLGAEPAEGLRVLGAVRDRCCDARMVVLYDRLSDAELATARRSGADMVVPASHGLEALILMLLQYRAAVTAAPAANETRRTLTDQEREIISLVGAGHTVSGIAQLLQVSPNTVEHSKRRIYHKLDAVCQSQAVARAAALGLTHRSAPSRPTAEQSGDGEILAILRGPDVPARRAVVTALLRQRISFVSEAAGHREARSSRRRQALPPEWRHRGPVILILVEPDPPDWARPLPAGVPAVLVNSAGIRPADAADAVARGVTAIIGADRIPTDLVPALLLSMSGYVTIDAVDARAILSAPRVGPGVIDGAMPDLTDRERDILRSIARGHTVRQTARSLGIAEKTVENTQARLFRKLGARNRAGALSSAYALGLPLLTDQAEPPTPA